MRKIYIVRHGEPDFPGGIWRCVGSGTDLPLSEKGRAQAAALAPYFDKIPITSLWSSPMARAKETACLMTGGKYTVSIHQDLREVFLGQWEGLTIDEAKTLYPVRWAEREQDMSLPPTGGEPYADGGSRFEAAIREILAKTSGDMAVAAHMAITCAFLCRVTGTPVKNWRSFSHDYASINELTFDGRGFTLVTDYSAVGFKAEL